MLSNNTERFFIDSITIYRKSKVKDNFGGFTATWEKKYWQVKCRIYNKTGRPYQITIEGAVFEIIAKLMCNRNIDIVVGDKIIDEKTDEVYFAVRKSDIREIRDTSHIEVNLTKVEL